MKDAKELSHRLLLIDTFGINCYLLMSKNYRNKIWASNTLILLIQIPTLNNNAYKNVLWLYIP